MGINDKVQNSAEKNIGSAKETAGKLLGDKDLERAGKTDQASAGLKQAGEKIKDAAAEVGDRIKDAASKLKDGASDK